VVAMLELFPEEGLGEFELFADEDEEDEEDEEEVEVEEVEVGAATHGEVVGSGKFELAAASAASKCALSRSSSLLGSGKVIGVV